MKRSAVMGRERPARLNKRITPEQHQALSEALGVRMEDINPSDAFTALLRAEERGLRDIDDAVDILLEAGVMVEVRPARFE
jgi:hypothetical protein